jgi:hypothetical protein
LVLKVYKDLQVQLVLKDQLGLLVPRVLKVLLESQDQLVLKDQLGLLVPRV